jgi:putative glutamine amidotransferase
LSEAPRIGISFGPIEPDPNLPLPRDALNRSYTDAVWRAGGVPLGLAPAPSGKVELLLDAVDGLVLTGGWDVDPGHYGQSAQPEVGRLFPERDEFEIALARAAMSQGMPLLAVCRGCQVLNVALGGSLIQHLPDHPPRELETRHEVEVDAASALASLAETETLIVNSIHHQSVDRPGEGVRPVAWSADGVVEAFEVEGHPEIAAVQWHPELLPDSNADRRLFERLVEQAGRRRGKASPPTND